MTPLLLLRAGVCYAPPGVTASDHQPGEDGMRKKLQVALLSAALTGLPVAQAAQAAPVGGCAEGFQLMTVADVLRDLAAPGFEATIQGHDRNADTYLCVMTSEAPGLVQMLAPYTPFIYTDNNVQRGR
jgi:hypothetical protein